MYFLTTTPIVPLTDQASMFKLKYTWYEGQQPYLNLDSVDRTVKFTYSDNNLTFSVPAIISENSRILTLNYTFYLSNDSKIVKAASQCGLKGNYSKSVVFRPNDRPAENAVIFEINKTEIASIIKDHK